MIQSNERKLTTSIVSTKRSVQPPHFPRARPQNVVLADVSFSSKPFNRAYLGIWRSLGTWALFGMLYVGIPRHLEGGSTSLYHGKSLERQGGTYSLQAPVLLGLSVSTRRHIACILWRSGCSTPTRRSRGRLARLAYVMGLR